MTPPRLLAISDLHIRHPANRRVVQELRGDSDGDWLIVAGDVAEHVEDVEWALGLLRRRFATVVWAPGNHELWTLPRDPVQLRGEARYRHLVEVCRGLGVLTPEDPYAVWDPDGEPVSVAPLFVLYDYSFRPDGWTKEQALDRAYDAGVVCTDEYLLYPDPHPTREAWCVARVEATLARLGGIPPTHRTVLVSHFPLRRDMARVPLYPEFELWCGTALTEDWHRRFRAAVVVSGHLHIPSTRRRDGVRFEEVSLGYPQEWWRGGGRRGALRHVLPLTAEDRGLAGHLGPW